MCMSSRTGPDFYGLRKIIFLKNHPTVMFNWKIILRILGMNNFKRNCGMLVVSC